MGIADVVRPEVIASGFVTGIRERRRKEDQVLYRKDVSIRQESGAGVRVEYWIREPEDALAVPPVATQVAIVAEIAESAQYGASLSYVRDLTVEDLEALNGSIPVKA